MATAKQIAWRKKFAAMAKAGTLKKSAKKTTRKSNPVAASAKGDANKRSPYTYDVQRWGASSGTWTNIAGFDYQEDAIKYAKQMARENKAWTVRVVDNYAK